jgi:beta-glucosidase
VTALSEDDVVAQVARLAGRFPPGFLFGVASSAYQIEGAAAEDGRGPSIWDRFSHEPGRIANGETGDVATDHYHRLAEDLDLMRSLGVEAYRFSVSWPRVLPAGTGPVNEPGMAFYERLVDGLLERGITPVLTLYHWDLPDALQAQGGWASPAMIGWLAEYAALLAGRLGDRVSRWVTLNEPQVFTFTGYARGRHAPGHSDWPMALQASAVALQAHGAAAERVRDAVPGAQIGVSLDMNHVVPATGSDDDERASRVHRAVQQEWFLDPLFGRGFPELALQTHRAAGHLSGVDKLSAPMPDGHRLDFIGLNYYTREVIAADAGALLGYRVVQVPVPRTTMGWEVHPDGLRQVALWLQSAYRPGSIIVTENGAAFPEPASLDGKQLDDAERVDYLASHIAAAARALEEGVPLEGYFAWSLLDNFEWEKGLGQRFGIVHVDYATLERRPKASAGWYAALMRAHHAANRGAA